VLRRALVLAAGALLLAGCAGTQKVVTPAQSVQPAQPARITVTEADAGKTVQAGAGDTVVLVLHSTGWSAPASSPASVLQSAGAPTTAPSSGPSCRPGSGCGITTETFTAAHAGTAHITATRTSCGEARRCTGGQGTFDLTVVVAAKGM
jgi:hypothetical protein